MRTCREGCVLSRKVEPRFKEVNEGPCGCGCGLSGKYRVRAWRDGTLCVKLGCKCPRCRAKRNRTKGDKAYNVAKKQLHAAGLLDGSAIGSRHEERAGGRVRIESKEGAQCRPAITAARHAWDQSEAARPIGDPRPIMVYLSYKGEAFYAFRSQDLDAIQVAFTEAGKEREQ